MKKIGTIVGIILAAAVIAFGGFALGTNHGSDKNTTSSSSSVTTSTVSDNSSSSSASSSTSQKAVNPQTSSNYDPNKTLSGQTVDSNMIQQVTAQLKAAGLPADQWAPSDITKIITQASQQGISPVDYAKQNYHSYGRIEP